MTNSWTTEIITQLRIIGISQKDFAAACGYSEPYMSQILRGRKTTEQSKQRIYEAIELLTAKAKGYTNE